MLNRLGGTRGTGPVTLPFQSEKIPVTVIGRIEWLAPTGFGTQPPPGKYLILEKPLKVNGHAYTELYMGRTREALPPGRVSVKGKVYEVAHRVAEGEQRYAVLEYQRTTPLPQRA